MNASGMTKRNVALGSAVELCDLSLCSRYLDAVQQASSQPECTQPPTFMSVWPQSMIQFFDTPIVEVCHKPTQGPSRSRKTRLYRSLDDMQWYLTKVEIADRILVQELTTQNLQVPVRESHLCLLHAPEAAPWDFESDRHQNCMIAEILKFPRPGDFLGGLSDDLPLLSFSSCFSFCLGLWLSVARHERESGGAHVVKCDMFGSGLAPVGDEIRICPGDLSKLLVLGFFVRRLSVQGLVIPVRPGRLSFGITTRIWEMYLFEWFGLGPSGQLLACSMRIGWHLTIPNYRVVLAKSGCWTAIHSADCIDAGILDLSFENPFKDSIQDSPKG